jgi:hypothetical protein
MRHTPPDFFLGSREHRGEWATARACWLRGHLRMEDGRDCVLVEVDPPVIGQPFGLGDQDIADLILAPRRNGAPLAPVADHPVPVLVYRILDASRVERALIRDSDVTLGAWGEVYSTLDAAQRAGRGLA